MRVHDTQYKDTLENNTELTGLVVEIDGKYYFTDMIEVPVKFVVDFIPVGFKVRDVAGFVHTHPDGSSFNGLDYITPSNHNKPSFMRNRDGDVFRWDPNGAKRHEKRVNSLRRSRSKKTHDTNMFWSSPTGHL